MINPLAKAAKWFALRGNKRSKDWPEVRRRHLAREGWCRGCGAVTALEVHHVIPFGVEPWLELHENNLLTLCENAGKQCHLRLGHLGSWKKFDPMVRLKATAKPAMIP
jgi:5-methylcytosine-specific restriction endonuclease McrA